MVVRTETELGKDMTCESSCPVPGLMAFTNIQFEGSCIGALFWLTAETPISILSICLPSIFFLCRRLVRDGPYSLFSVRYGSTVHAKSTAKSSGPPSRAKYGARSWELRDIEREDDDSTKALHMTYDVPRKMEYRAEAVRASEDPHRHEQEVHGESIALSCDQIMVQNDVHVSSL
jgi:hypothetical protein